MNGAPRRFAGCAALAVSAGLLLASPAAAMVGNFSVGATHGFRVKVVAYDFGVYVGVSRSATVNPKHGNINYYLARTRRRGEGLDAKIGDLGRIQMRFHRSGATYSRDRLLGCTGPDHFTYHRGVFVGSFEFRGEGGFTEVHVQRAKGVEVTPRGRLHCTGPPANPIASSIPLHNPAATWLFTGWRSGPIAQFFSAASDGRDPASFRASRFETRGPLAILREASARGAPSGFATDSALSFATVTPPAPFSGTGELRRDETGARTWTGSLAVSYLGVGATPLTGANFKTTLGRGFSGIP